ncbi:hypothetical protein [Ligilactobacillus acidipiscis]|uniref:hypothetical protein n=1 Tax=Ligilactobacillus acidipiscis TaxID=89059 RepID=UPI0023F87DA2|nr:hypothetical protein [Ligilactobacillus acidipiscis]WEV56680.1 hypothetical protein OZX66_10715 [Ligilactobacillus acidipiscis]
MFANLIVAPSINQPNSEKSEFNIVTGNTFELASENSYFSFGALVVLGDFDKRKDADSFKLEFFKESNPDKKILESGKQSFPNTNTNGLNSSATLSVNFTNVVIPSFGKYVLAFLVNDEVISKTYLSFREGNVSE